MFKKSSVWFFQLSLTILTCAFLIVPVVQSVMAGLTANYFAGIKSGLTIRWLEEVWRLYSDTILRSVCIGLACLLVDLVLGVPAAYVMVKKKSRLTRILEEFLVIPLAVPGLATALGILITYGGYSGFRKTSLIILAGHVVFTLPFMIRAVTAVLNSFDLRSLEEASASLGAGFWKRFKTIVVPNVKSGILAGALMVFTLSIGEFNLTWMLHTPLTKTLPVGLADSYASMRLEIGSAYTITFFFMIIPLLIAMQKVAGHAIRGRADEREQQGKIMAKTNLDGGVIPAYERATPKPAEKRGTSICVTSCGKTYPDGTKALDGIDLKVEAGETIAVLGPSGCGKTTLLRIIAGLDNPDRGGRVHFGDDDVTNVPVEKRNVGMVFQSYALFPNMSVAENIAYGLKIRGEPPARRNRRVEEMLSMMQIGELASRRIDQLSGGQKQRVALARAVAVRPRVLLLDEPLTALDAKLRDSLRIELDLLLRSIGITSIYVTHDQAEAMAVGDRIVVMNRGRTVQIGTPREVYFNPASRFVAEFIGNVNSIESVVQDNCLKTSKGAIRLDEVQHLRFSSGPKVKLYFRPEHAVIAKPGEGHLQGTVESSFFLGDRTRVLVKSGQNHPLKIETSGRRSFQAGQPVDIRLDLQSLFTLDE